MMRWFYEFAMSWCRMRGLTTFIVRELCQPYIIPQLAILEAFFLRNLYR